MEKHQKEFIESVKIGAQAGWVSHKILPSVSIAQGILESDWGRSDLAQKANNLFGIKGDYQGYGYNHATKEYANGKFEDTEDWFRNYPSTAESIEDHSAFFTSTNWRKENYKNVIGETDYKKAAQALQAAGYATDPDYAEKLIGIIDKYELFHYDGEAGAVEESPLAAGATAVEVVEPIEPYSEEDLIIDAGHGGTDPGANGFGVNEKEWTLRISLYQYKRLKELGGKVAITRTGDTSLDSVPRTDLIRNKYDVCVSNHWNAYNGEARGVETIHSIHAGKKFATDLADAIVKASGIPLRRVFSRKNNSGIDYYYMHRLTGNTETVIIEYGFLDNKVDHNVYKDDQVFYAVAEAVIEVLCKKIGIVYRKPNEVIGVPEKIEVAVPVAKPATKPVAEAKLDVDGYWGKNTTTALQKYLGTPVDGVISGQYKNDVTEAIEGVQYGKGGSLMIKALQKLVGAKVDGYIGPETVKKLQKRLGTPVDGVISKPSMMVKELQRRLNKDTF